ncbi:MAG: SBBP repeat-containing protein, partial [Kiritimatiellia bacterium]|nr:SBBP repeat-containing protein [Kiritimatiellia bacterium]
MSGARTYLVLLLAIAALVGASGGLGYYFFAILPEKRGEAPPPQELLLDALDPDAARPTEPGQTDGSRRHGPGGEDVDTTPAWSIGPSGRESRFGFKAPASAPPIMALAASTIVMDLPQNLERRRKAGAPMELPPLCFEELCEDYSGEFDLAANGASLDILPGGGAVALRIEREHIDLTVSDNIECGPEDSRSQISDLDCTLDVSLRLVNSGPLGGGSPPGGPSKTEGDRLDRWHHGGSLPQGQQRTRPDKRKRAGTALDPVSHYAMGTDPALWFTDVNGYPIVQYPDVFPGINMDCYAERNRLEFIFTVGPDGDPGALQMAFDGAELAAIDPYGNMIAELSHGRIVQHAPRAFRIDENSIPVPINARFQQHGPTVQLDLTPDVHSPSNPPPTGPQLDLLSYLGGEADDTAFAVAVDHKGFTYVAGETASRRFAGKTPDPKRLAKDIDVFITKYRAVDGHPVFTTFLGGSAEDRALDLVVAPDGSMVVCGETLSRDFPLVDAPELASSGQSWDAFLTHLDPEGKVVRSARIGGSGDDHAHALALASDGTVVVSGDTASDDFAGIKTLGPCGEQDAFVLRVKPGQAASGVRIGGSGKDAAYGVAVDGTGRIFLTGETASSDFPTSDAWQAEPGGGVDAFVAMLDPVTLTLGFSTYVGAENDDRAYSIALDSAGYTYLAGETASLDLRMVNPVQSSFGGGMWDAFVCKLEPEAMQPVLLTYFGGTGDDRAFVVVPNAIGEAALAGETSSTNLPVHDAVQAVHGGGRWDGFGAAFAVAGSNTVYCTYLGGSQADHIYGGAMQAGRLFHVSGQTSSTNLVPANAVQTRHAGGHSDGLLAMISPPPNPGPDLAWVPGESQPGGPGYGFHMARFETTNDEFVRFLNDAQAHTNHYRGTNLTFDAAGNVWFNPEMEPERDEVFAVGKSRIEYNPEFPIG